MKSKKLIIALSLIVLLLVYFNFQKFSFPDQNEITQRINFLQRVTDTTLISRNEVAKVGEMNQEFKLFTYSFTTYAVTNLVIKNYIDKKTATKIIKNCIENVLKPEITYLFNLNLENRSIDSLEEISVLYAGHLNLMLGCYKLISDDDKYSKINSELSNNLINRYNKSASKNLESYPGNIWIPDNSVAIASLNLYNKNYNTKCDSICFNWVKSIKDNYTNNQTELLYSTIDVETAKPLEETRGSMLGWSIMFIYQFDEAFATQLYKNYKKHFSNNFLIYQLFKERKGINSTDIGDIDSGPLFLGYSIPANTFALSNAILSKDLKKACKIERMINSGSKQITDNEEYKYKVRFVDIEVSPMAEAIVLFSMSMERWVE